MESSNLNFYLLFTMLLLASGVAIVTKWIKLPYSIALVMVGLAIGLFHFLPVVTMTPELILLIFLPALLFEASWNFHLDWVKACYKPVAVFATLGVLVSTVTVGLLLHSLTGMDLNSALLFGAMISATDPISVLALFKRLRVNRRLHTILEGESLLNDGTAVALFRVLLASIIAGTGELSWAKIGIDFLFITCGGIMIGALVGMVASKLTEFFDDHLLETTLTVLVAYGSYILAEQFHVSSVISVLVAGFTMGNFGSRKSMSATTRLAVDSFWEYAAFIAESLVFLLIGMQIDYALFMKYMPYILSGIAAIFVSRVLVIYGLSPLVADKKHPLPWQWRHLLFWGGLRGSLCMAMVLSLPQHFPQREMLVVTTFGVAIFTLLVPGLTMEPLVKLMKVSEKRPPKTVQLQNELDALQKEKETLQKSFKLRSLVKNDYKAKVRDINDKLEEREELLRLLDASENNEDEIERIQIETALINAQKYCLVQLAKKGGTKPEVLDEFRERIDAHYLAVRGQVSGENVSLIEVDAPPDLEGNDKIADS